MSEKEKEKIDVLIQKVDEIKIEVDTSKTWTKGGSQQSREIKSDSLLSSG
jgi:hypothetical protein